MASHDDLTYLDRKKFMEKGVHISEFPRSAEAIDAARAFKSPIILGAPNVVRGGSHCGAVDATASVLSGHCDILASDYYYPALLLAPFKLTQYGLPLSMAWRLVSKNPARTLGLDNCGEIDVGKSADLLLIDDRQATLPKICMTMCDGEVIHLTRRDLMLSEVTLTV
jgi:alpha-D-ribose 1-methylphosphonate 5-triphosphate diphosphatase